MNTQPPTMSCVPIGSAPKLIHTIPYELPTTPLLDAVNGVIDLRQILPEQLPQLAYEIRLYLLYCVGKTGGHLGAGLGVVELTIALHYLLDTPHDRLIWDVGHQTYPHKILTGRKQAMLTMRKQDGLAAFAKRAESPFDCFGVGHASTSISALLGMALTDNAKHKHVAIIGDGALTGGMAYEALNHMAHTKTDALVILNDNDMSISQNTGGLAHLLDAPVSNNERVASGAKAWFTALGYTYVGGVDGHDLLSLLTHIKALFALPGPKLLHLHTIKGKGYGAAEQDPVAYHAIDKIAPVSSTAIKQTNPTYSQVFGQWAEQTAHQDPRMQVITPAMVGGSGLAQYAKTHPTRLHDVTIAEQHALTLAAGMACNGAKPVVAIYSTFLQRGYDQLIHDIALQNLDVLLAVDRAGIVGEDGATHTGAYDYSFLACLPNMSLMAPSSQDQLEQMLTLGFNHAGPVAVRYPRAPAVNFDIADIKRTGIAIKSAIKRTGIAIKRTGIENPHTQLNWGQGALLRRTQATTTQVAILNFGALLDISLEVAQQLDATLVDMRFVKPLDTQLLQQLKAYDVWLTVEDHAMMGGAGALVCQWLAAQSYPHKPIVINAGIPDTVVGQGTRQEVLAMNGLDAASLITLINNAITQVHKT